MKAIRHLLTIILLMSLVSAKGQTLPEPQLLLIDSSITKIPAFNQLIFPKATLISIDTQVVESRIAYTFQVSGHAIKCYYYYYQKLHPKNLIEEGQPIYGIEFGGDLQNLLNIYNKFFSVSTTSATLDKHNIRVFTYHGVDYSCSFDAINRESNIWRLSISRRLYIYK